MKRKGLLNEISPQEIEKIEISELADEQTMLRIKTNVLQKLPAHQPWNWLRATVRTPGRRWATTAVVACVAAGIVLGSVFWPMGSATTVLAKAQKPALEGKTILAPAYITSLQKLGADVISKIPDANGNILISPLSLSMAFSMTMTGAQGTTLEQMRSTLQYGDLTLDEIIAQNKAAMENLYRNNDVSKVLLANSIWSRQGFDFQKSFLDTASQKFFAQIAALDFDKTDAAKKAINDWVSKNTNGLIDKGIDNIDPATVMFLINTLYFKADWQNAFDKNETEPGTFTAADGKVTVDMMHSQDAFSSYQGDGYQAVALPYKGGLYMILALPDTGVSPLDIIKEGSYLHIPQNPTSATKVILPKFNISADLSLKGIMPALGMTDAFDPDKANFANMSSAQLYIGDAKQKSVLKVNEKGTEAASMTDVEMRLTSMGPSIPTLTFDRPFAFAIVDGQGVPLFMGAVNHPAK